MVWVLAILSTDTIKEWTTLPIPELLTRASSRKDWKRISAESSPTLPPPTPHPDPTTTQSVKGLNWTELNWTVWTSPWSELNRKRQRNHPTILDSNPAGGIYIQTVFSFQGVRNRVSYLTFNTQPTVKVESLMGKQSKWITATSMTHSSWHLSLYIWRELGWMGDGGMTLNKLGWGGGRRRQNTWQKVKAC